MTATKATQSLGASRDETRFALGLAVGVALFGAAWSIADHFAFGTKTFDSGVIDNALWRVTHGFSDVSSGWRSPMTPAPRRPLRSVGMGPEGRPGVVESKPGDYAAAALALD